MKLHLNKYLDLSINVIPVINRAREASSSLFCVSDSAVLSMFLDINKDIDLQVLHNGVSAVGFSGTRKRKIYEYKDNEGHDAVLEDATEIHVYVMPGEEYDAEAYVEHLTIQLLVGSNLIIEIPDTEDNKYYVHLLTRIKRFQQVGHTDDGNIVFYREY